jgi:glutamate synthase (ferredoxin)
VNAEMVFFESLVNSEGYEVTDVQNMIRNHVKFTGSTVGHRILENWEEESFHFVKIIPKDYKRMFEAIERGKKSGLSNDKAILAAFEENMRDVARVGGN